MQRSYRQNCALAQALDCVGERWTLLIIRELLIAPRRYKDFLENLVGIGTNLLADRLHSLEERGIIRKNGNHYLLTDLGRLLEPVVHELVRFGLALDVEDEADRLTRPEWDVVALKALYRPDESDSLDGYYVIELDGNPFCIEATGTGIRVQDSDHGNPRVRVALSKATARKLAASILTFNEARKRGDIKISGNRQEARQLLRSFTILPQAKRVSDS